MSRNVNNELAGFVMRAPTGTVGVVESNTDHTVTLYVLQQGALQRVIVPRISLDFLAAGPDEFTISLRLYRALPDRIQARPEMRSLYRYIVRIGGIPA